MLGLQINNVKLFMNKFLATDCFDQFLLEKATITTYNYFEIDGHMNQAFYGSVDEPEENLKYELSMWSDMRNIVFYLIKGKRTPLQMKFVLQLKPEDVQKLLEETDTNITTLDIHSMILTVRYEQGALKLITGISYRNFVMDKTMEQVWDQKVKSLLLEKEIEFEE